MIFSVGKRTALSSDVVNVGIVPGRFDTKQIILTALVIIKYEAERHDFISIVRTLEKSELEKCSLFITDGFASKFPSIQSYSNVEYVWNMYGESICNYFDCSIDSEMAAQYAKEKICNIEAFDILSDYNAYLFSSEDENTKFKEAVEMAIKLITQIIMSSVNKAKLHATVKRYIDCCSDDVLYIPLNINIDEFSTDNKSHIKWIIVQESEDVFVIASMDKSIDIRQIVKDRNEVIYAGRFFCKVTSYEVAKKLIDFVLIRLSKIA